MAATPDFIGSEMLQQGSMAYQVIAGFLGQGWESVLSGGELSGAATAFLEILKAFNAAMLAATSGLVLWSMTRGAVGTANEGTAFGRSMSTFWTPLRSAISVGMLVPIKSGLSALQILILVTTGLSISAADWITAKCVDSMVETKGAFAITMPASVRAQGEETARTILAALAMQQHFVQVEQLPVPQQYTLSYDQDRAAAVIKFVAPFNDDGVAFWRDTDGSAGAVEITCPGGLESSGCVAQINAVLAMVEALTPLAEALVTPTAAAPEREPMAVAVDAYVGAMQSNMQALMSQSSATTQQDLVDLATQVKKDGFFALGSYYFSLTRLQHKLREEAFPGMSSVYPDWGRGRAQADDTDGFDGLQLAVERYASQAESERYSAVAIGEDQKTGLWGKLTKLFVGANTSVSSWLLDRMASGDPVFVLADLGDWLCTAAGWILTVIGMGKVAAMFAGAAAGTAAGPAGTVGGAALAGLVAQAGSIVLVPAIALFILGIMLCYYLPILPAILFITSTIGWVLLLIESLVAAPLWCLAHALPGHEEGLVTGRSGQGYMLISNILMRPPLLVAAFFLSFVALTNLCPIVAAQLKIALVGLVSADTQNAMIPHPSLLSFVMSIVIVAVVMSIVLHRVFKLTTEMPERIIRWIGGGSEQLGEHEAEAKTRTAVLAAGRNMGTSAQAGISGGKAARALAGSAPALTGDQGSGGGMSDYKVGETEGKGIAGDDEFERKRRG